MIIYEISLDDEVKLTPQVIDNVRLLAYLVYSELINFEEEVDRNILFKDNIVFNELYDGFREKINRFEFEHNDYYEGIYEPFMINESTFGFTVYDNSITDMELMLIIEEVKKLIMFDTKINIKKNTVLDSDERMDVIHNFYGISKKLLKKKNQ